MSFINEIFDFNSLSNSEIKKVLEKNNIALSNEEVLRIQNKILKRPPTLSECILWSIQGSEHCSYKSSRIHLNELITDGPNIILGPKEDAGIVSVAIDNEGKRYGIVISHESHNHPSQIVPYEGAATGVGGNVRDVSCMGAKVIGISDSLRFGDISSAKTKWIKEGVISGIAGYGNPLGIPNIGGDLYFDEKYNDNCLVTIVTIGIVREDQVIHSMAPKNSAGYDIILIGKPTDNSGFGGASFASLELNEEEKELKKAAVQEPNAFLERHILKATYSLFDKLRHDKLDKLVGFKDLGAGGIACASVELADSAGLGAEIFLDNAHVSQKNLHPSVVLCSETQERFMWVAHPDISQMIVDHYNLKFELPEVSHNAKATIIGKIRSDDKYIVHSKNEILINAKTQDITKGFIYNRKTKDPKTFFSEPNIKKLNNLKSIFLKVLSHENVASREPIFEYYDKQVQGRTILESGEADSGVLQPFNNDNYPQEIRNVGIAISTDHNPRFGKISPYWCAINAIVEAIQNVVSVGATPQALTDCLCFGNPEKPEQMWQFVESIKGIKYACEKLKLIEHPNHSIPIISGNVSFYNESKNGPIPSSPIISCVGKINDIENVLSKDFKKKNSIILLIGKRKNELGGSVYYNLFNEIGKNLPKPDLNQVQSQIVAISKCIENKLLLSVHDISDGGLAVTIAEMMFKNKIGCNINLEDELSFTKQLFSETGGYIIEIEKKLFNNAVKILNQNNVYYKKIGETNHSSLLNINSEMIIPIQELYESWKFGLREKLK